MHKLTSQVAKNSTNLSTATSQKWGRKTQTNRWNVKCLYCTPDIIIEHHELRCTEHLAKYEQCPNTPEHSQKKALQQLATRHGALSSTPIDKLGMLSNPHIIKDGENDGVACKKWKAADGSATKRKRGTMDTFVDHGFSEEEKAQVDSVLLRYTHSAAAYVEKVITHHQSNHLLQQFMVDT